MAEEPALILVVDDNEMNRDMLSRRLKRLGHNTMVAEDGQKALDMLQTDSFDLVLLDIMMPNLNGYDTLEQIKSNSATRHIPVIMISAVDDLESIVRCIELGAEDYLFKPFNPILLKARVGSSLEKMQLHSPNHMNLSTEVKTKAELIQKQITELNSALHDLDEQKKSKIFEVMQSIEELIKLLN